MKEYLIRFFYFNNNANLAVLQAINRMDNKEEALKLITHLIASQKKWFYRVVGKDDQDLSWFPAALTSKACIEQWKLSFEGWITYLERLEPEDFYRKVTYKASEGGTYTSNVIDIVIQLIFHSIHHRAQILRIIREGGTIPPSVDYILSTRKFQQSAPTSSKV